MEMEILDSSLVYPSPLPSIYEALTVLPLSHLDTDRNLHLFFRTLRLYAAPSSPSPDLADVFADALSAALSQYSPLTSSLRRRPCDSRLEVQFTPAHSGVPFTRATSSLTLAELDAAGPGSSLLDGLAPELDHRGELVRPLALQLTRLACGSFALGMCVHHAMCDGAGATQFLSAVAEFVRGASRLRVDPIWDRSGLLGPRSPPRVDVHSFYEILAFDDDVARRGPYDLLEKLPDVPLMRTCFHVSEPRLDRFRNQLAEAAGSSLTTFEALSAFIWRSRVKASGIRGDEAVKLVYSMNIRKIVKPALPAGYWGTICVPVYVHLSAKGLIEQPLPETAKLIKKSKLGVTDDYVRSYVDFQELHYAEGITAGKRVSAFTDWRHLGHSDVDFGWGGPVSVAPLSWRLLGSVKPCFLLPYGTIDERNKDGFKVLVSLPELAMAMHALRVDMEIFS